jgi:succinate-semialdehyde dehydrogenase/glutarate-semialdehyde dehydrogenase
MKHALIIGVNGIVGLNLCRHLLLSRDWKVTGVARHRESHLSDSVNFIECDVLKDDVVKERFTEEKLGDVTHIFFVAWLEVGSFKEQEKNNLKMLRNVVENTERVSKELRHVYLQTGSKHYAMHLGPQSGMVTPNKEEDPRPPKQEGNFYYPMEDYLRERVKDQGTKWTWSNSRPPWIIGYSVGKIMNVGVSLAAYASLMKELGQPLIFPYSKTAFNALRDYVDVNLLCQGIMWMATTPHCANNAFNLQNGDYTRWARLWPKVADYFGMDWKVADKPFLLADFIKDKGEVWERVCKKYELQKVNLDQVGTWQSFDIALQREWDDITLTNKARCFGFQGCTDTEQMFFNFFDTLQKEKVIPPITSAKKQRATLQSINPVNGELIKEYNYISDQELENKIDKAWSAFQAWKDTDIGKRAEMLRRYGRVIEKNMDKYANQISLEMGKTLRDARIELERCAKFAYYYADNGQKFLADVPVTTEAERAYVACEPLGVVFQVAPFNYPFLQVLRFATGAIVAGNTVLVRHAHSTTGCNLLLEESFREAGFPEGVFQALLITREQTSKVIGDLRVKGCSVTGGVGAGAAIAKQAGEHLKKTVMELGGCDAYIVCDDCDMDWTIEELAKGRCFNNGECCAATKRAIVLESKYDEFVRRMTDYFKNEVKMGDPKNPKTYLGPLARADLRDKVHQGVQEALKGGAKLMCGGKIPDGPGSYYPATVLADVNEDNYAFQEEIFGPVLAITRARDENDAIRLSNKNKFALGGGCFTKDIKKAERIGKKVESGMFYINRMAAVLPEYPFGGLKLSGCGRECGEAGLKEWVNHRSYVIGYPQGAPTSK